MNRANGFIVLHRKMLDWEWHNNPNTLSMFIHILLGANHEDNVVHGVNVKRGQLLTSLPDLAKETGQTIKQVRVSLSHLVRTGEVADESTNQYRIITVLKYNDYQDKGRQQGRQRADDRAGKGQATGQQYNNNNNKNNKTNKSLTRFIVPTVSEVQAYVKEKGYDIDAQYFVDYYEGNGWVRGNGQKIMNWKAVVNTWQRREHGGESGQRSESGTFEKKHSDLYDTVIRLG